MRFDAADQNEIVKYRKLEHTFDSSVLAASEKIEARGREVANLREELELVRDKSMSTEAERKVVETELAALKMEVAASRHESDADGMEK